MSAIITAKELNLWYGKYQALHAINLPILQNRITALIGPSGCGKSTFLKTLNRMNDLVSNVRISGEVLFHGRDIYAPGVDVNGLRKEIGMVFAQVLEDAGVYKLDEFGREGFVRFLASVK